MRKFDVSGVVGGKPERLRQPDDRKYACFRCFRIDLDRQTIQRGDHPGELVILDASPALSREQSIADFECPDARDARGVLFQAVCE